MVWRRKVLGLVAIIILAAGLAPQTLAVSATNSTPGTEPTTFDPSSDPERFGIDFISSVDVLRDSPGSLPQRYAWASQAGANWNRWPFYWPDIESSDNNFNYGNHDSLINSEFGQGIRINAVLMNTPGWATTAPYAPYGLQAEPAPPPKLGQKPPRGLQPLSSIEPTSASAATYPPRNLYEKVFSDGTDVPGPGKTINPGNYWARFVHNTVARYRGKVSHWEIWNEPDFRPTSANGWFGFWSGSVQDYARLLKVGYLAAKHADSSATVIMGGMAYWANTAFFGQLLDQVKLDPTATTNSYFFDVTAWHWYSRSSQMYDQVAVARNTMSSKGITGKSIWVNESGMPAWDDPQRPPFGGSNTKYPGSGTMDEQASYVIQALAYGLAANVDKSFIFQELDDGNGEAFGLIRNNGSQRPAYKALQVASQYFESHIGVTKATSGSVERIVFWGTPKGKVTVLWNKSPSDLTYTATPATATRSYLVDKAGNTYALNPASPSYSIFLPRATNNNNHANDPNDYIIGGSPYLLVEEAGSDTTAPSSQVTPLPAQSSTSFVVSWSGADVGWGIMNYDVEYKDGEAGVWRSWLSATSQLSATFTGTGGRTYNFRSRARDFAGNVEPWPAGADAWTAVGSGSTANLRGYVKDNRGNAIIGAVATVDGASSTVDGSGEFRLNVTPGQVISLRASKNGFGTLPPAFVSIPSTGIAYRDLNLPPADNVVLNCEFESGLTYWSAGGFVGPRVVNGANTGSGALALGLGFTGGGDVNGGANSTVEQRVNVPDVDNPTISFKYWLQTSDTLSNDKFEVIVVRENGQASYLTQELQATSGYTHRWFDLGPWRGTRVRLIFNVWQSSGANPTAAYIDEVSVGSASPPPVKLYFPLLPNRAGL